MYSYPNQNTVMFPQNLKECLLQANPEECKRKLTDALVTKSTRDAFKAWADRHPAFVKQSPLMNTIIKEIEIKEHAQPGMLTKFTDTCVSIVRTVLNGNPLAKTIEQRQYYDFTDRKNFKDIKNSLCFFEEYMELGLIHKNQLIQALTNKSQEFGYTLFHHVHLQTQAEIENLHKLFPMLKQLSPNELTQVFSIPDNQFYYPPLFYLPSFEIMLPFLKTLPMDVLVSIIDIRSSHHNNSRLLQHPVHSKTALVLLDNRSDNECEQFFNLLATYPMNWASHFKLTLPYIEKMPLEQQARILTSQPNGTSLLHLAKGIKAAWPLLVKFPPDLFIEVMTAKNQANQKPLDFITDLDSSTLDIKTNADLLDHLLSKATPRIFKDLWNTSPVDLITHQVSSPLNKMNEEQFIHLLSKSTPRLFKDLWDKYPPVKALKSHRLLQILCSIAAARGNHEAWKDLFTIIDPLYSNFELMVVMASPNEQGKTLLHHEKGLAAALPILNKLRSHEIVSLLSNQDGTGQTPLHSHQGFALLKPLLEKLFPDDCLHLLTIKDANGICPLVRLASVSSVWPFNTFSAWPLLKKMNLEQSAQFLALAPLNIFAGVITTPSFKNLSHEELVQILTAQAAQGKTAYWREAFAAAKPKIEKLPVDQFIQILSVKDPHGDPLLFTKHGFEAIAPLLKTLPAEYQQKALLIQNADGLSRNDLTLYTLSDKWLKSSKVSASLSAAISSNDYNTRVASLKKNVNALWDTVAQGLISGKVNPKLLEVNGKLYTSAEILSNLNAMIELMISKQAWMGTPSAFSTDALHSFYSVMLVNFEQVAAELVKRNNPIEIAGFLTSIATVSLEGRCASAYQAEIEQKSHALSENMDLNSFVKKAASNSLASLTETIIRTVYGSNVHDLNQFHYAAGLTSVGDHLASISPAGARASIEKYFTFSEFYRAFSHGISNEHAMEWLKGNTPDTFGPEYKEVEKRIRNEELRILKASEALLRDFFSEDEANNLSRFLTVPSAPTLSPDKLQTANREDLLMTTLQQALDKFKGALQQDSSLPDIQQLYTQIAQAHNEEDRQEILQDLIQKIKKNLDTSNMPNYLKNLQILASLSGKLPKDIGQIESFHKTMSAVHLTPKQLLNFLRVKQTFDSKVEQLGATLEDSPLSIVFVPSTHRLPSLACEDARRIKYNADFMSSRGKMLIHILEQLGTIEKKTAKSTMQEAISRLTHLIDR